MKSDKTNVASKKTTNRVFDSIRGAARLNKV